MAWFQKPCHFFALKNRLVKAEGFTIFDPDYEGYGRNV